MPAADSNLDDLRREIDEIDARLEDEYANKLY